MSLSIPYTFTGGAGNKAKASEINANFQAIANKFSEGAGGISDSDISSSAGIKGTKLTNVAGNRIPTDRIEDKAITFDKLKDDTGAGSPNAAVNTAAHVKDGILTTGKLKVSLYSGPLFNSAAVFNAATVTGSVPSAVVDTLIPIATAQILEAWIEGGTISGNDVFFRPILMADTGSGTYKYFIYWSGAGALSHALSSYRLKIRYISST